MGAGTTSGSFQIQPLRDIHAPIGFTVISGDLSHGSEVYVTVITENHAGLVRAFQATSPVKFDHTPPVVDTVVVYVDVVEVNITGSPELQEDVTVNWSAADETSDINYCTCAIGMIVRVPLLSTFALSTLLLSFAHVFLHFHFSCFIQDPYPTWMMSNRHGSLTAQIVARQPA